MPNTKKDKAPKAKRKGSSSQPATKEASRKKRNKQVPSPRSRERRLRVSPGARPPLRAARDAPDV